MPLRDVVNRYGPVLAPVVMLIVLIELLPDGSGDAPVRAGGPPTTAARAVGPPSAGSPVAASTPTRATAAPAAGGQAGTADAPGAAGGVAAGGTPSGSEVPASVGAQPGAGNSGGAAPAASGSEGGRAGGAEGAGGDDTSEGARTVTTQPAAAGSDCRPEDGRQPGISLHQPPCVARFTGDNGGATARGVTGDKIVVARWIAQENLATSAALYGAGAADDRATTNRMTEVLFHHYNTHFETYGREVVWVDVVASGPETDETSQRADAVRIAEEIGAFATYGAPAYAARELAARNVICICALEQSRTYYATTRDRVFSTLHLAEEYYANMAEYQGKRLAGKPAKWAGDPALQAQTRAFGLIWPEGATFVSAHGEGMEQARNFYLEELAKYDVTITKDASYRFDVASAGEQSTNLIAQMKNARVTTLAFFGDPLTPIFLTKEATRQLYFPEWYMVGTVVTDTTIFGRAYDQAQWAHAFGQSPLWVFWANLESSRGYREYHHSCPDVHSPADCEPGDEGVTINAFREVPYLLFLGFHMAGPNLTPDSYAQGMYAYPPTGGIPTLPLYDFTPESPTVMKDFTEVFWDAQGSGEDETGNQGVGILLKVDGGRRYRPGEWPASEPKVFDRTGTVFTSDEPPSGTPHEQDGHTHAGQRCRSCTSG